MARTCEVSEKYADFTGKFALPTNPDENECIALASSAINCAKIMDAKLIVVETITGRTARILSNLKPNVPIIAICDNEKLGRRIGLNYAVYPVIKDRATSVEKFIADAKAVASEFAEKNGIKLEKGDKILITAGFTEGESDRRDYISTNLMKIDEI